MKRFYLLFILAAALAAALVACTREELPQTFEEQPQTVEEPEVTVYTLTVEATKGGDDATRALSLSGKTLSATWAEGEAVTVYNITRNAALEGSLTAQSAGAETTLKGTLTGTIAAGDDLRLMFLSPNYSSQNGTLEYIASHCDYAEATTKVSAVSNGNITASDATFTNQQAIVKFILKDIATGNPAINATNLTVTTGATTINVTPSGATDVLFVAIPGISGQAVSLSADITPAYIYTYEKSGVTFANSQYYEITVKMTKHAVNLAALTSDFTAAHGDVLTGTLSRNVRVSIANGATVTLENASLAPSSYPGLTCLGSATINLVGENTTNGAYFYAGILIGGTGTTLTINGPGSLSATGGLQSAGIGLSRAWSAGTVRGGSIVINGGTIIARGNPDQWGSGIGTGVNYSSTVSMGDITINGGNVTAIGGANGCAGIGTSYSYVSASSSVGNIAINGGSVTATGTDDAAAIGTGHTADGNNASVGNITIASGTVVATGGQSASTVIGRTANGTCGNITLGGAPNTPTITLNNPHNSGGTANMTSFMNPGSDKHVYFPDAEGMEYSSFNVFGEYWIPSSNGYRYCCTSVNQFRYEPYSE